MAIDTKEVEKIADLARLIFNEEEKKILTKDLNQILGYIDTLNQLNEELEKESVKPMAHVLELENHFHDDVVEKGLDVKDVMKLAPKSKNGFIVVPKII